MPPFQKIHDRQFSIITNRHQAKNLQPRVSVSKKVAPLAVDRNRIKRVIREALRKQANLKWGLMVIVKENIASLKTPQVAKKLNSLLAKFK